ncbi:iron chelate uptake ABC transporter family permease subunit [Ketogulonicigenium vulgare]|uniref:iron chelate uptake ABC transporter family permease subunit n=1 Tax=Ketogulonicigenium vulgare TaxID=92945 RepID=UPI00081115A2|nr:iron chelate uptake ABC transporter family permease subunit [Ketogulonicigenium vulgare]ANW33148.1 hypothetical protein KvSKV_03395 [Ketogulonicigenium vulgare]
MRYPLLLSCLPPWSPCCLSPRADRPAGISVSDSLAALFTGGAQAEVLVMREIRLPRTLLAAMIGAALGLAGAVQGWCAIRWPSRPFGDIGHSGAWAVIVLQTGWRGRSASAAHGRAGGRLLSVLLVLVLSGPAGRR